MNKDGRKQLALAIEYLEKVNEIIQNVTSEEQDKIDNTPENMQSSERYDRMTEIVGTLENVFSEIENLVSEIESARE